MGKLIGRTVACVRDMTWVDVFILLTVLSPFVLSFIFVIVDEADQRGTGRRLESRPDVTWREILSPEERRQMGHIPYDGMESAFRPYRRVGTALEPRREDDVMSVFETEDFHNVADYHGGLDGEFPDIDFHEVEDYYGD